MGRTRRWIAVGVAIVALADLSAAGVYLAHPSGIVVRFAQGERWQLFRDSPNPGDDPVIGHGAGPIAQGRGAPANDHLRLAPGRYWVRVHQNTSTCFMDQGFRVVPHRWTSSPDKFAAPSCSIQ